MDLFHKAFESVGKFFMSSPYFLPCLAIAGFFAFQFLMILPLFIETAPKETPGQLERELDGPALPPSGREGKGREEMRKEEGREDLVGVGTGGKRRGGVLGRERRPTLE